MKDGRSLGDEVGFNVGLLVRAREGESVGFPEGEEVGTFVGLGVGFLDGTFVGLTVGFAEGLGLLVGLSVGELVNNNGCVDGVKIPAYGRFITFPVKKADRAIMRKLSESKRSVHQSNFEPRAAYM